jgi:hypothetical protein
MDEDGDELVSRLLLIRPDVLNLLAKLLDTVDEMVDLGCHVVALGDRALDELGREDVSEVGLVGEVLVGIVEERGNVGRLFEGEGVDEQRW